LEESFETNSFIEVDEIQLQIPEDPPYTITTRS